jgi:hypothetical protein
MSNKISFTAAEQYGIMLDTDEDRLLNSTQRFIRRSAHHLSSSVRRLLTLTRACVVYGFRSHMQVESWLEWKTIRRRLPYYMPITMWLPKYNWRQSLVYDLFAGVAVAAMIIPQVR